MATLRLFYSREKEPHEPFLVVKFASSSIQIFQIQWTFKIKKDRGETEDCFRPSGTGYVLEEISLGNRQFKIVQSWVGKNEKRIMINFRK